VRNTETAKAQRIQKMFTADFDAKLSVVFGGGIWVEEVGLLQQKPASSI
jgi:hypothetical protein